MDVSAEQVTKIVGQLRVRIEEQLDLVLFDEAVNCLGAQAYRAAYIVTWISIAESLRRKFFVMSQRDAEIGKILRRIEEAEQQERPTDRLLLDNAKNLGLVGDDEYAKLDHIREMRNIYAHPSGVAPTQLDVLNGLDTAVELVLGRAPLLRHGYASGLATSLFEDRHYLDDVPEIVREFAEVVVLRLHPQVLPYLVGKLLERLEDALKEPELNIFARRGQEFGRTLLSEAAPDFDEAMWNVLELVQRHPRASAQVFSKPNVWVRLSPQCSDMVLGHLVEPTREGQTEPPSSAGLGCALGLWAADLLSTRQEERFRAAVEKASEDVLLQSGCPLDLYVGRVLSGLTSHNWYTQNPACQTLREAGQAACSRLATETQEQLGRNVLQAADGTAGEAMDFVEHILKTCEVWPKSFVEGLLLETLVNDDDEFRLKADWYTHALKIAAFHPEAEAIYDSVCNTVQRSSPKDWDDVPADYRNALTTLSNTKAEASSLSDAVFDRLGKSIELALGQAEETLPQQAKVEE